MVWIWILKRIRGRHPGYLQSKWSSGLIALCSEVRFNFSYLLAIRKIQQTTVYFFFFVNLNFHLIYSGYWLDFMAQTVPHRFQIRRQVIIVTTKKKGTTSFASKFFCPDIFNFTYSNLIISSFLYVHVVNILNYFYAKRNSINLVLFSQISPL